MKLQNIIILGLCASLGFSTGCKKSFLDTTTPDGQTPDQIFANTKNAYKAINGLHSYMSAPLGNTQFGHTSFMFVGDLLANDMPIYNSGHWFRSQYSYIDHRTATGGLPGYAWGYYYTIVNNANLILERIDDVPGLQSERNDLKGQALVYRAFAYMNLIQYFQHTYKGHETARGVPIYTKGTVTETVPQGRGTVQDVYNLIESDLNEGINLLDPSETEVVIHSEKSHINKSIAIGLKARLMVLMERWGEARDLAIEAASEYDLSNATELLGGMNNNLNSEWMWATTLTNQQISNLSNLLGWLDSESAGYAKSYFCPVTEDLYQKIPPEDIRKGWIQFNSAEALWDLRKFRAKIPNTTNGDNVFMRASEMYFIAAEASAKLGDFTSARGFLEELMEIRNNTEMDTVVDADLLEFIYLQRRIEFIGEGFGFFDLKRLKRPLSRPTSGSQNHDPALAGETNIPAEDCKFLFMIPQREFETNPNMDANTDQNNCM